MAADIMFHATVEGHRFNNIWAVTIGLHAGCVVRKIGRSGKHCVREAEYDQTHCKSSLIINKKLH